MNYLAQGTKIGQPISGVGTIGDPKGGVDKLAQILSTTVGALTIVAAIYFMFNIITGGIQVISAGGDKGQVEDARRKITNGAIGLVIVIAGMFIIDIVARLLGVPDILNLQAMVTQITK